MTDQIQLTPLGAVWARLAEADPDRPSVTCEGRTVTRLEFDRHTNRLARAYAQLGVKHGDMVTIGLPNSIEFLEAVIATWKLGATPQPISSHLPSIERTAIIELAAPALVVGVGEAEAGGHPAVPIGFVPDASLSDEALELTVAPSLKAPTSGGSTGRPKLIVSTTPAALEYVELAHVVWHVPENGVHLCTGPLYHNGPFSSVLVAMIRGNEIVIMPRFDATKALQLIEQHRVDWMYAVPTMMHRIWRLEDRERYDLSSLRIVYHLAAPIAPWLKAAWIEWLGAERILELYGGTEGQAATVITGTEWLAHRGSVGRPQFGEMTILDEDGNELPRGEVGQVWMRSGAEGAATYKYIGAESKVRDGHWEWLGDVGWMDEDGYVYLSDRETDMILVGGANVYPAEVESAIAEHESVMSCAVIGFPDDEYGNVVHAIVQTSADVLEQDLDEFVRERLAKYKCPRSWEFTTEPLRDDAGKVRRSQLRTERLADR